MLSLSPPTEEEESYSEPRIVAFQEADGVSSQNWSEQRENEKSDTKRLERKNNKAAKKKGRKKKDRDNYTKRAIINNRWG